MTQVGAAASAVDAPSPLRTKRGLACFSLYARTPIWIDVVDPTSPHSLSCPFPLRVRKGEKGVSLQAEIRGLPPISNSACLSHLGFCENTACESHYCSCIGPLDSVILGPIVAFSADLFCRALSLGFPIGFQPSASAKGSARLWLGACLRRIVARDSMESFA